jgi:hypothetical protein
VKVGLTLDEALPPQFDSNSSISNKLKPYSVSQATRSVFKVIEAGLSTSFIANFALAAVMKLSMKHIWGIINTLQILTTLPKLVKSLPSNLSSCLQTIQDVVSLKLIPKPWVESILKGLSNNINSWAGSKTKSRMLEEAAG